MALIELIAKFEDGNIELTSDIEYISQKVMDGNIVILKHVFEKDFLLDFRKTFLKWSETIEAIIPANESDNSYLKENHHRIDDNPLQSETPHRSHFYNLMRLDELPEELSINALKIFGALRDLQNQISGTKGDFLPTDSPILMRPQIIQYPSGGGYIGEHFHPIEPQKIGLITGLSRKGIDYKVGGTTFKTPHGFVDSGEHDIGDITLFRYNLLMTELNAVGGGFMSQLEWGSDLRGSPLPVADCMESLFNSTFDHNGSKPPLPYATEADAQGLLTMLFMTWLGSLGPRRRRTRL